MRIPPKGIHFPPMMRSSRSRRRHDFFRASSNKNDKDEIRKEKTRPERRKQAQWVDTGWVYSRYFSKVDAALKYGSVVSLTAAFGFGLVAAKTIVDIGLSPFTFLKDLGTLSSLGGMLVSLAAYGFATAGRERLPGLEIRASRYLARPVERDAYFRSKLRTIIDDNSNNIDTVENFRNGFLALTVLPFLLSFSRLNFTQMHYLGVVFLILGMASALSGFSLRNIQKRLKHQEPLNEINMWEKRAAIGRKLKFWTKIFGGTVLATAASWYYSILRVGAPLESFGKLFRSDPYQLLQNPVMTPWVVMNGVLLGIAMVSIAGILTVRSVMKPLRKIDIEDVE